MLSEFNALKMFCDLFTSWKTHTVVYHLNILLLVDQSTSISKPLTRKHKTASKMLILITKSRNLPMFFYFCHRKYRLLIDIMREWKPSTHKCCVYVNIVCGQQWQLLRVFLSVMNVVFFYHSISTPGLLCIGGTWDFF